MANPRTPNMNAGYGYYQQMGGAQGGFPSWLMGSQPQVDYSGIINSELTRQMQAENRADQNIRMYGIANPISDNQAINAARPISPGGFAGSINTGAAVNFLAQARQNMGLGGGGGAGSGGGGGGGGGGGINLGELIAAQNAQNNQRMQLGLEYWRAQQSAAEAEKNRQLQLNMQGRGFENDAYSKAQDYYKRYGI